MRLKGVAPYTGKRMKQKKLITWILILLLIGLIVWKLSVRTKAALKIEQDTRLMMDTIMTVTLVAPEKNLRSSFQKGFDEMQRIADLTDRHKAGTEINRLNTARSLAISKELAELISLGEKYRKNSNNAFDIRIGKLSDLWGFGTERQAVPSEKMINAVLPQGDVIISGNKVNLPNDIVLDLGALAKGYAIEKARTIMKKTAPSGLILGGGSSVAAWGEHPEKRPWRIGLKHPRDPAKLLGVIELNDGWSLGTSGDYERYFSENGKRYHHILDSQTGYPVPDVYACTILIEDSTLADILSTLLFVLGPQKGQTYLEQVDLGPLAVAWVVAPGKIVTYEKGAKLPKLSY